MELKNNLNLIIVKEEINKIWNVIESGLNDKTFSISSEKTLVFKFAWLLKSNNLLSTSNIDFEKNLFNQNFSDGKFIDLYFEVQFNSEKYRIGIEFKFPNKKLNGSGSTEVRQKMINDLKKIDSLVQDDKIDLGIFLCATNEKYYLLNKKRKEEHFATYNNKKYLFNEYYPCNIAYTHRLKISNDILFNWRNADLIKDDYFSFLDPIIIIDSV